MNSFFYQIIRKASDMIYSDEFRKKNITNKKSFVAIFQEYYSAMFLMNCMSAMKLTVDHKLKKSKKHCRYLYEGNRSLIIGCFKHRIPVIILYPHKRIKLCQIFSHQSKVFSPEFSI